MKRIYIYKYLLVTLTASISLIKGVSQEITVGYPVKRSQFPFTMGEMTNPSGETLTCDTKSFILNGHPIIPVMGEMHYLRYEPEEWKQELLKMKAGGITIVATYAFWIYHEEEKDVFDWNRRHDIRRFAKECQETGLLLMLRCGPFCHGEVRNGGLPDWIVDGNYKIRSTDPDFMERVKIWYANLHSQLEGLLWKDGGPVIGMQVDNEYSGEWEYLKALKDLALSVGFDLPLYTRTGWPALSTQAEYGQIIPLYGEYADGFWDRSSDDMPGEYANAFVFHDSKLSSVIASEQFNTEVSEEERYYPYLTCELGGGMMPSYHRRISIEPMDVYATALVKVGSGSNLPGYYMYHGGTNLVGKNHTLNENQDTPYMNYNDLPVMTYDFQAPLGEFGQTNDQYHWLRRMHIFLTDFGEELSDMDCCLPEDAVDDAQGDDRLRWAVRSDGKSGFVFVNNYQRMKNLSEKQNVHFSLTLPDETIIFPENSFTVPSGAAFYMPFNLHIADMNIKYATAQPFARIHEADKETVFFAAIDGVPVEMLLQGVSSATIPGIKGCDGLLFKDFPTNNPVDIETVKGNKLRIVVLDEETSLKTYKAAIDGQEYMFISNSGLSFKGNDIIMEQWGNSCFWLAVYPELSLSGADKSETKEEGFLTVYSTSNQTAATQEVEVKTISESVSSRIVPIGSMGVAKQPSDSDFNKFAAKWLISGIDKLNNAENLFLKITYKGDVARVYSDSILVEDNFCNGKPMYVPVSKLKGKEVTLSILPSSKDYPIYFQKDIRDELQQKGTLLQLNKIEVVERKFLSLQSVPVK